VTISLGVASVVPKQGVSPATLVAAADRALYQAKRSGRNCVELSSS
jgi:diguanylate cyclase (GGDEF)-like protein